MPIVPRRCISTMTQQYMQCVYIPFFGKSIITTGVLVAGRRSIVMSGQNFT